MIPSIALDVDGVICNWWGGIIRTAKSMGLGDQLPRHENWNTKWYGSGVAFNQVWDAVKNNRDWWMGLDPIQGARESINFRVEALITARPVPSELTSAWARKNGFRFEYVYTPKHGVKKSDVMRARGVNVLVDDKPDILEEIRACSDAPLRCYLFDQPWNRLHADGGWRIKSLSELPAALKLPRLGDSPPPILGG